MALRLRGILFLQLVLIVGTTLAFPAFESYLNEFGTEVREKRDVLKGKNHDLIRSKRYIGRVPVAYMKKALNLQPYGDVEDENSAVGKFGRPKPMSHFRELIPNDYPQQQEHHRYGHNNLDTSNLTDEEIQTLLLMLDGYELNSNSEGQTRPRHLYNVGKRETGKRSLVNYEQPMSFDNSLFPGADKLEFLGTNKRSGGVKSLTKAASRVKKETDPAVFANLGRVFSDDDNAKLPGGNLLQEKTKKSIDWSNYLGIDKRADKPEEYQGQPIYADSAVPQQPKSAPSTTTASSKAVKTSIPNGKLIGIPLSSGTTSTKSGKKDQERKENETLNKEDDRKWVLEEFYKNFAMMTNVKRKREAGLVPYGKANDLEGLNDLEQKMTQVGDKIIWDALKYTGAHRDSELSASDLTKVKANVLEKLATAYSLEKVRKEIREVSRKLAALTKSPLIGI